ncbi:MAG: hypothetical protein DMG22_17230 [Acidobacteria bacterium]|nr:MAG: hypothetical protein DMG22_17230 [Acidobacteriota bacterium]
MFGVVDAGFLSLRTELGHARSNSGMSQNLNPYCILFRARFKVKTEGEFTIPRGIVAGARPRASSRLMKNPSTMSFWGVPIHSIGTTKNLLGCQFIDEQIPSRSSGQALRGVYPERERRDSSLRSE